MLHLKNYHTFLKPPTLILLLLTCYSSFSQEVVNTIIEGKQININEAAEPKSEYNSLIAPYRDKINRDLDEPLAVCSETLDKSKGQFQSNIGDFLASIVLEKSDVIFQKREKKNIDACILNHGGIRAIMPQGNVSARTAYEILPFENTAVVVELKGEQIIEFIHYFITEKKPHPIAGLTFSISAAKKPKNVKIKKEPIVLDKTYYIVTNDYLANGGDKMDFFKKGTKTFDLDYKMRNILIDYMKDVDAIKVASEIKVVQEK